MHCSQAKIERLLPQNVEESNVGELLTPAEIQRLQLLKVTSQSCQSWSPKVANLKHVFITNKYKIIHEKSPYYQEYSHVQKKILDKLGLSCYIF